MNYLTYGVTFFQDNETVRELRLRSNKIGNKGGMAFAQMLQVGSTKTPS